MQTRTHPELSEQPKARQQQPERSRQRSESPCLWGSCHLSLQRFCTGSAQARCKLAPGCSTSSATRWSRQARRAEHAKLLSFLELLPFQLRRRPDYSSHLSEAVGRSWVLLCPTRRGGWAIGSISLGRQMRRSARRRRAQPGF